MKCQEYTVNIPLSEVERKCGQTLEDIQSLLREIGIESDLKAKDLRLSCPCSPDNKDKSLSVYIKDKPQWKCHRCDLARKKFNSLIGLVRAYKECSPWEAVNLLFDTAHKNETKSKTRLPIALDNYKGKLLHEIPPHKLYWLLIAGNSEIITQEIKDEIVDRLIVAPF